MLCKRHCTGIEPAVDDFRHTLHGLAAVRTGKGHFIDIRTVKFYLRSLRIAAFLCQLRTAADGLLMSAALALPDI